MQDEIYVEASYRVVGKVKGQLLAPTEKVMMTISLKDIPLESMDFSVARKILFIEIEVAIKNQAAKEFIQRLKTNTELKRKVGGIQWSIELPSPVEEMPLYLDKEPMGAFMKYLNAKNPYQIMKQNMHRNFSILQKVIDRRVQNLKKAA